MNFDFSDDQRLLQEEVRKMLAATSTSCEVRKSLEGEHPYFEATRGQLSPGVGRTPGNAR